MRNGFVLVVLILLCVGAFYFLGKKTGREENKVELVQNVALIKEIAELAALNVSGTTTIKSSNLQPANGVINRLKNYFGESTLNITIPFEAKYGIDMSDQKMTIDTKDSTVIIYLAPTKLLSLQLRLDRVDAISKTGVFRTSTPEEFVAAQKQLYNSVNKNLEGNENYKKLAREHIEFILSKYYTPLGYKVRCVFTSTNQKG